VTIRYDEQRKLMSDTPRDGRSRTAWEGSRRAQLRAALELTVRERLPAMQALGELSERLAARPRDPVSRAASTHARC
jgi:hypothetical protein